MDVHPFSLFKELPMRRTILLVTVLATALLPPAVSAQTSAGKTLDVYVIDVEGGNATLFVSPNHESLLIDTGNAGPTASKRDAGRIIEAIQAAGLQQLDHVIITHWHGDHFGGLAELAAKIPIREYIDHGPNVQPGELADNFLKDTYAPLAAKAKHTVAKPGDKIAMAGVDIRVVASADQMIKTPLPGAGKPNPYCASFKGADSNAEDPQSVAVHLAFGKFRTVHLGDLSKNEEFKLMCPNNLLGTVDVLLGLHHGVGTSNSIVMVHALHPRVAIMNNGTRKGGDPETMKTIHSSPGLEDLWQLHFSTLSGQ
jgi:beta-lactamase superfamily II metal-dependent hydrolase